MNCRAKLQKSGLTAPGISISNLTSYWREFISLLRISGYGKDKQKVRRELRSIHKAQL